MLLFDQSIGLARLCVFQTFLAKPGGRQDLPDAMPFPKASGIFQSNSKTAVHTQDILQILRRYRNLEILSSKCDTLVIPAFLIQL